MSAANSAIKAKCLCSLAEMEGFFAVKQRQVADGLCGPEKVCLRGNARNVFSLRRLPEDDQI
jgi:hypothetical protein